MTDDHVHDPEAGPGDPADPTSWPGEYTWCPMCRSRLEPVQRDEKPRMSCPGCGFVHWRDPAVGAAVLVRDEAGRILLVQRGPNATRAGYWCIPAGYVDYGEDVRDAAARELNEETGLDVEVGDVIYVASNFHDPTKLSIGIWFAGDVIGGTLRPADDAVDAGWFALDDLPPLAFPTDTELLTGMREATPDR